MWNTACDRKAKVAMARRRPDDSSAITVQVHVDSDIWPVVCASAPITNESLYFKDDKTRWIRLRRISQKPQHTI